jgi:menaquinone-dependent protoporphyrinogen oxidase
MKTLIVYASKHGSTEKAAHLLKEKLKGTVTIIPVSRLNTNELKQYSHLIIGSSIHAGRIQKPMKDFCSTQNDRLKQKHLGLFLCCMDNDKAQEQFNQAYPEELRTISICNGLFGGEFLFEKMNFLERFIVKKISKVNNSVHEINVEAITRFAQSFNKLLA